MKRFGILLVFAAFSLAASAAPPPNIVFILADDLGYGDLGCYGQTQIRTPAIDLLAAEGMRFTQFYAGASVCAPSRCVLMTGRNGAHSRVRGNAPLTARHRQSLMPDDVTVAARLRQAGYATACIGKWGLGMDDMPGAPWLQGFDFFFGYLDQVHAHNFFPEYVWRNGDRVVLPNEVRPIPVGKDGAWGMGGIATKKAVYSPALMLDEALAFLDRSKNRPFFLYFATTLPHANNEAAKELGNGAEAPDLGLYKDRPWPEPEKGYAAMISYLDTQVGALVKRLRDLGLEDRTLVIFASDNGPERKEFTGYDPAFFHSAGGYRGFKRDHTEGGIRVPFVARWPGRIAPGAVSAHAGHFADFLPTALDLAGLERPAGADGTSLLPVLLGRPGAARPSVLHWEYHGAGTSQAVLLDGRWKGLRNERRDAAIELYDLTADPGETHDVAAEHPELVARVETLFKTGRTDDPNWPLRDAPRPAR